MDWLTLYGLVAVTAMVAFYAAEGRHQLYTLAFAGACGLASVYGFLAGTWLFGVVEAVWAVVALGATQISRRFERWQFLSWPIAMVRSD